MISLSTIIILLIGHYVADFVCQTDWMARNKSHSFYPRFTHILVYVGVLGLFALMIIPQSLIMWFLFFNGFAHYITDKYSSRITSKLAKEGKYGSDTIPNFGMFSIIGLDQLLHYIVLFSTYVFLMSY